MDHFAERLANIHDLQLLVLPPVQHACCINKLWQTGVARQPVMLQASNLQPITSQGDSVIKVKSLPYDACQLDVLQFFDGFKMRPNGVQLVIQGNNKPSGEVSQ